MRHRLHVRTALIKPVLLVLLAGGGLIVGLFLAERYAAPQRTSARNAPCTRFPLTQLDARETAEAPDLAVDGGGRIYLVWPSKAGDDDRKLYLTTSDDGGHSFADPRTIARSGVFKAVSTTKKGQSVSREVRMAPHIAASGGSIHLLWTETLPDNAGVRTVVSTSSDHGRYFSEPIRVHSEPATRATYTALAAANGSLLCSWLDNRNGVQQTFAAQRSAGQAAFDAEIRVHAGDDKQGVCPCCPTGCLLAPDGTAYVVFRDVESGYRDFVVGRKMPGDASFQLFAVVPPTWTFNGCPHDGASLALVGDRLSVVWMDAHTGSPRCYYAEANAADMKFKTRELHPIATGTQGNAKLAADASGGLHAVWEESLEAPPVGQNHDAPQIGVGRVIMYAALPAGAAAFSPPRAVEVVAGAYQSRPSIVLRGATAVIAWNELDDQGKAVVVTTLKTDDR